MKNIFFAIIFSTLWTSAQKPELDSTAFGTWYNVDKSMITNDGNYASYEITNLPRNSNTLVVKSLNSRWERRFPGARNVSFTSDSKFAIIINSEDSLSVIQLGGKECRSFGKVNRYQIATYNSTTCLVYSSAKNVVVLDFLNERKPITFYSVENFCLSQNGHSLVLKKRSDSTGNYIIDVLNVGENKITKIWQGSAANNFVFDTSGTQLAFIVNDPFDADKNNKIAYYREGAAGAIIKASDQSPGIDNSWSIISAFPTFNDRGDKIFFSVKYRLDENELPYQRNPASVDVWSYKDRVLQSKQLRELEAGRSEKYIAVTNIGDSNDSIYHLNFPGESQVGGSFDKGNRDFVVVSGNTDNIDWYLQDTTPAFWVVSTKNGSRRLIKEHILGNNNAVQISPSGKYLVYIDRLSNQCKSFDVNTGSITAIARDIPFPVIDFGGSDPAFHKPMFDVLKWFSNDSALLICDQFDIWKVDPVGIKPSINITKGFGRKSNVVLRVSDISLTKGVVTLSNSKIILVAFNSYNKENGFFEISMPFSKEPKRLTMGPYIYNIPYRNFATWMIQSPLIYSKAKNKNIWIVRRMSETDAPNYFTTTDFRKYNTLTDISPQVKYNWLTTELVTWQTLDGNVSQGILYKPENFDAHVKYPLILNLYEKFSDGLHQFLMPDWSASHINIPYFVSRGYLVFSPDICYTIGQPGRSIEASVIPAVRYISQFEYVDSNRIGLHGHSFGGYEVYYLVSHSKKFSAAVSAAGPSDFVGAYDGISFGGMSSQSLYEIGQNRIGHTLWEEPNLYVENSPVFYADKIATPLLIMQNKADDAVPFSHGEEMFTALRRLGKKSWLLQYDCRPYQGHQLISSEQTRDYTMRIVQFFDHFLKNKIAPKWMINGVEARYKGFFSGME